MLVLEGGMLPILYGGILHLVRGRIFGGPLDDGLLMFSTEIFVRVLIPGLKFAGLLTEVPANFFLGVLHFENGILQGEEAAALVLLAKRLVDVGLAELFQNILIVLSVQTF